MRHSFPETELPPIISEAQPSMALTIIFNSSFRFL